MTTFENYRGPRSREITELDSNNEPVFDDQANPVPAPAPTYPTYPTYQAPQPFAHGAGGLAGYATYDSPEPVVEHQDETPGGSKMHKRLRRAHEGVPLADIETRPRGSSRLLHRSFVSQTVGSDDLDHMITKLHSQVSSWLDEQGAELVSLTPAIDTVAVPTFLQSKGADVNVLHTAAVLTVVARRL